MAYVACYLFVHSDTLGLVTVSDSSVRLAANTVDNSSFMKLINHWLQTQKLNLTVFIHDMSVAFGSDL